MYVYGFSLPSLILLGLGLQACSREKTQVDINPFMFAGLYSWNLFFYVFPYISVHVSNGEQNIVFGNGSSNRKHLVVEVSEIRFSTDICDTVPINNCFVVIAFKCSPNHLYLKLFSLVKQFSLT